MSTTYFSTEPKAYNCNAVAKRMIEIGEALFWRLNTVTYVHVKEYKESDNQAYRINEGTTLESDLIHWPLFSMVLSLENFLVDYAFKFQV